MIKQTGGGTFEATDKYIYFLASNPGVVNKAADIHPYLLVAVNELKDEGSRAIFEGLLKRDNKVFLDSGVFNLASEYAKTHGVSHDVALRTPLHEIGGFNELFDLYVSLVKKHEDRLWGYIEIDIGGRDQKRETRKKLEELGLRPIPVYHILNDDVAGNPYWHELASQYDRICVGNVVQASRYIRTRIIATIHALKQQYPHLWIHLLGVTPHQTCNAYPVESMDSSSWLSAQRWCLAWREFAGLRAISGFPREYWYKKGVKETHEHSVGLTALQFGLNNRNWQTCLQELDRGTVSYQGEWPVEQEA